MVCLLKIGLHSHTCDFTGATLLIWAFNFRHKAHNAMIHFPLITEVN